MFCYSSSGLPAGRERLRRAACAARAEGRAPRRLPATGRADCAPRRLPPARFGAVLPAGLCSLSYAYYSGLLQQSRHNASCSATGNGGAGGSCVASRRWQWWCGAAALVRGVSVTVLCRARCRLYACAALVRWRACRLESLSACQCIIFSPLVHTCACTHV